MFSLLCKAGHFLPLVVDPCNEADAARGREGRRKGDEKAEWWLQDHVGVHPTPRIVSHLGSLKASPGLLGKDNQNWPPRLRCHPPSGKKRRSREANKLAVALGFSIPLLYGQRGGRRICVPQTGRVRIASKNVGLQGRMRMEDVKSPSGNLSVGLEGWKESLVIKTPGSFKGATLNVRGETFHQ